MAAAVAVAIIPAAIAAAVAIIPAAIAAAVVIIQAAIAAAVVITPVAIAAAVVTTQAAIVAAVAIIPAAIAAAVAITPVAIVAAAAAATILEPAVLALIITQVVLGTVRPGMAGTLAIIISGPSSKVGSGLASLKRARALIRIPFRQMGAIVTRASSYVSEWPMWHFMTHKFSSSMAEGRISEFSRGSKGASVRGSIICGAAKDSTSDMFICSSGRRIT